MSEIEIPFNSGESTKEVVRIGNTVRRSLGRNSERTHSIYKALENAHFELSPRLLGIDEKGREIITYINGTNVSYSSISMDMCVEAIKALRRFHDILADTPLKKDQETICHRDFAPWNLLKNGEQIVGIIDYDDAYPGKRVSDLAYACWTFLDIGSSSSERTDNEQIAAISLLVESYGKEFSDGFVESLLEEQKRILKYRKNRVELSKDSEERSERLKQCEEIQHQIAWVKKHANAITHSIL